MSLKVITDHPLAADSIDHLVPRGTKQDNSRNRAFNAKLLTLFPDRRINVLDLGCSGGGFVKDMLDAGHGAVGLEGSDYSLKLKRAEWATIPNNLFTCDICHPFKITWDDKPLLFDVITSWEVLEHLPEDKLATFFANVRNAAAPDALFVGSVSDSTDLVSGVEYHCTVHDRAWWNERFAENQLRMDKYLVAHFGKDWIRGPWQGCMGFNVVARINS